jgi:hypothetical protein
MTQRSRKDEKKPSQIYNMGCTSYGQRKIMRKFDYVILQNIQERSTVVVKMAVSLAVETYPADGLTLKF